jgi:hypothetical protein
MPKRVLRGMPGPSQAPENWHPWKPWRQEQFDAIKERVEKLRYPDPHHFEVTVLPGLVDVAEAEWKRAEAAYRTHLEPRFETIARYELARDVLTLLTRDFGMTAGQIREQAHEWRRHRREHREREIAQARSEFADADK